MKINIAFVIGQLTHGGSEKQLYLLCKGLDKTKYNIIVFCLSENRHPWGDRLINIGVKVVFIPRFSRFDISRVIKLVRNFYVFSPKIIVSLLHTANVYCGLALKIYNRPVKYLAQIRSKENTLSFINKYLNIYSFNVASLIITNTKLLIPFIIDYFQQDQTKIIKIDNAISLRNKLIKKDSTNQLKFGIIGKDTKAKNIELFINCSIKILNDGWDATFHLCGRGLDHKSRFKDLIPVKYLDSFIFYGEIDNIKGFYKKVNIFLLTSISEGFPNVLLEAMSYGIPVVSSNVGGISDLIEHGENGLIFESNDLDSFYKNVIKLISDNGLRKKISQKCTQNN